MGTYKCCIFFTRRFALGDTTTPEDVRVLFSRFAGGSPYMGADDLRRYLAAWGGADGEVAEQVVDRVLQDRSRTPRFGRPALTVDDFMHFLFSEDLNPPLRHSKVNPPGSGSSPNPNAALIQCPLRVLLLLPVVRLVAFANQVGGSHLRPAPHITHVSLQHFVNHKGDLRMGTAPCVTRVISAFVAAGNQIILSCLAWYLHKLDVVSRSDFSINELVQV